MKVIRVEMQDWQAQILESAARSLGVDGPELIRMYLEELATRQVDAACRRILDPSDTDPIEYRLAALFHY